MKKYPGIKVSFLGHIADGNIHPMLLDMEKRPDKEWIEVSEKAYEELCLLGSQLGGTVSGEHGIGSGKKGVLRQSLGDYPISLMRGIKAVFDPNSILNPDKIFDLKA
jgi:FAD/FMN-containing dehydrogenase